MKTGFVEAAYAVFVLGLVWDFVTPRLKLAQLRRFITQRMHRHAARKAA